MMERLWDVPEADAQVDEVERLSPLTRKATLVCSANVWDTLPWLKFGLAHAEASMTVGLPAPFTASENGLALAA